MQQAALTTAQVKRSPLTAVVALPAVLEPGLLPGSLDGRPATAITATMYNDGGEELEVSHGHAWLRLLQSPWCGRILPLGRNECPPLEPKIRSFLTALARLGPLLLQVGDSLCHFLTLQASIRHSPVPAAELTLLFGRPSTQPAGAAGGSNSRLLGAGCRPSDDMAAAAQQGGQFEWPELEGIKVLGWQLPVEGLSVEVVRRADSCEQLSVVRRLALPAEAAGTRPGGGGLRLDLSSLRHRLECPYGLRLSWSAGGGAALQAA